MACCFAVRFWRRVWGSPSKHQLNSHPKGSSLNQDPFESPFLNKRAVQYWESKKGPEFRELPLKCPTEEALGRKRAPASKAGIARAMLTSEAMCRRWLSLVAQGNFGFGDASSHCGRSDRMPGLYGFRHSLLKGNLFTSVTSSACCIHCGTYKGGSLGNPRPCRARAEGIGLGLVSKQLSASKGLGSFFGMRWMACDHAKREVSDTHRREDACSYPLAIVQ